ncbi:MAG: type 1 glutamine amidotransferase, partial [Candidatus Omnitrophica bacterium]|nr:type 1 glutamine amidotransferase [Candidatus Omnitrophota bacterium]
MVSDSPREVIVLQHVPGEGAGTVVDFMEENGIPFRVIQLYNGDHLPENLEKIRAVLIMGGPMNVYEEDKHPFLKKEDAFIKQLAAKDIPCLGVCLGAQLIAKALGKRVYKASQAEIGWGDVHLSPQAAEDPLFSSIPSSVMRVLQWHEDTFDLPDTAVHLASSEAVPNQAYRYGRHVYGLQFHVEVNREMLVDWFRNHKDFSKIMAEYERYEKNLKSLAYQLYQG